ncbi:hypothetical protein HDV62DRAFT_402613 [Trichoderma sp. SZMC 28011]
MSSGPPPGIDLYADIKESVISPVIALMVLSAICVALRIVAKFTTNVKLQLDDYFLFAALVVAWGTGAATILACYKGIGKHIWNPTVQLEEVMKILWAYEFLYGSVIPLTKLSLIFFYYRLFHVSTFRKVLWFVLFLVVGWWIAILVTSITQCRPYNYFWKQYVDPTAIGTCINIPHFFVGNAAASVATDFMILLTPIPMVWGLQMPVAQRLSVLGIFFLGGFVCVAGIVRIVVLLQMFKSADLTWNMSQAFIWSSVEPNIGIVCACLPTLRPLLRRCIPDWFAGSSLNKSGSTPHYGTGDYSSRLRSQTGDFYALTDRNGSKQDKSDDEMGLTNNFQSDGHQPRVSTGDAAAHEETHNGIMVKHEINWSSTSAVHPQ